MKASYTVAEIATLLGKSRRQTLRRLVKRGAVQPSGRGAKVEIPLTVLMATFGEELDSLALTQRLAG